MKANKVRQRLVKWELGNHRVTTRADLASAVT